LSFTVECRDWYRVYYRTGSLLDDEVQLEEAPPATDMHILEVDASAGIGLVAPNNSWGQESSMRSDISQGDVSHGDQRLSLTTIFVKRVDHAAGAVTTGLLLLLGTYVDVPPDGKVDLDVLVENIGDLSTRPRQH